MRLLLAALFLFSYVQTADQPLPRMVATEKAFAAATAEIGVRDGFLTFFADDSIELNGGKDGASAAIGRAKESLKTLPPPHLPLANRLIWEPFTGQMAADGTVGWLTGASVTLNLATSEILRKGAHLTEYAVLGMLLFRAVGREVPAFLLGVAYAITDEVHQHFVHGRHASPFDVAFDAAGVALGLLIALSAETATPAKPAWPLGRRRKRAP